jgi:hypothetical protein
MKHIPEERRIYHHWSYDPYLDEASLNDKNAEQNGYAYRIDGGWRLTDKDHNFVDDPYIVRRVMDQLRGTQPNSSPPNDYDFTALHYGQPLPVETENKQS